MNNELNKKVNDILEEMKMVYKNDIRPWVIGYSGGKDSTTVVQLTFMMLQSLPPEERHKPVHVISSDTLIENPIILGYLKQNSTNIHEGAKKYHIPIYTHMIHADYANSFWTNVIGKGLPTPTSIKFRWCTERLKINPSNKFIEEQVAENGEVVVLLGVRKAESVTRSNSITKREIEGFLLSPHVSLNNTYVYNPIVDLSTPEVWEILLNNNGTTPWDTDNKLLHQLYMGADGGECPFTYTNDKSTPSCGNSRFGCWICTVVKNDKSLTGFIKSGYEWLQPLLDFREWLLSIRDKHEYRMQYKRSGSHYYKKIYLNKHHLLEDFTLNDDYIFHDDKGEAYLDLKNSRSSIANGKILLSTDKDKIYLELLPLTEDFKIDESKIQTDNTGKYINILGYGPFTFEARQEILERLLILQKQISEEYDIELITQEELEAIDKIWDDEEDLTHRTLVDIYKKVMGYSLPWDSYKKSIFDKSTSNEIARLCDTRDISKDLINKLLIETNKYKHFSNKSHLDKSINRFLNQSYLHKDIIEEIENDN